MTGPRLPAGLARQLDRLARRAHRLHRWSHHPLCEPYAGEVLRLGRLRLCRGCTLAALGAAGGAALGLALAPPPPVALLAALALLTPAALLATRPRPPLPPRSAASLVGKGATRGAPALAGAALLLLGLRARSPAGPAVAVGTALLAGLVWLRYRRRGPDRRPCLGCPEYGGTTVCSGYRPIARREAAFQRLAGRLVAREGAPRPFT